jgi:two-component system NarL family sensor kinase
VATTRADLEKRISRIFIQISLITFFALFLVFLSGFFITVRERRLANTKQKALIGRIVGTQEEERGRVARELHDSISQILVGVRYALDVTSRRILNGDKKAADTLNIGIDSLTGAIQEVRRISRDLRPSILDDLGLSPAIKTLVDEFSQRTGITTDFSSTVFRNRLDDDSKIALYRIAQEALTNIERHSSASHISVSLKGTRRGGVMEIEDNGQGFKKSRPGANAGLGLRNMQERIEQLGGQFKIKSNRNGTKISAQIPLTHILSLNPNLEALK